MTYCSVALYIHFSLLTPDPQYPSFILQQQVGNIFDQLILGSVATIFIM